ncbi:hypothetical protein DSUL_60045 [Desulfovibrionales bacterium]
MAFYDVTLHDIVIHKTTFSTTANVHTSMADISVYCSTNADNADTYNEANLPFN